MDALLIVDMQAGLLNGPTKHDLDGVVDRINCLARHVRARPGGRVVCVQHCGSADDDFAPGSPGWSFLPALSREADDLVVGKTLNDPFHETPLQDILGDLGSERLLVSGWATDLCVDATVRSAVSRGHAVTVVADGHTVSDRPHLSAVEVIHHHHWVWTNLIARAPVEILTSNALLQA